MIFSLLAFIGSTLLLYFSSQALIQGLARLLKRITRSENGAATLLFFLLLPGTTLHELSHILSAQILGVHTGEMSLRPVLTDNHLQLGSAGIGETNEIKLTLIGTAPFVAGTLTLWLILTVGLNLNLGQISLSSFQVIIANFNYWYLLFIYLIFAISNTMFSSPSDLQGAALPIVLLLIILGLFQLTNLNLPVSLIDLSTNLFWLLTAIFSLVLVLNLLFLLPLRLLRR